MDYLISFAVSVMANIAAYIVAKWIDKQHHDKTKCRCTAIQRHFLVRLTGFEPAAFRVGAERSIQLSYNRTSMKIVAGTRFIV